MVLAAMELVKTSYRAACAVDAVAAVSNAGFHDSTVAVSSTLATAASPKTAPTVSRKVLCRMPATRNV